MSNMPWTSSWSTYIDLRHCNAQLYFCNRNYRKEKYALYLYGLIGTYTLDCSYGMEESSWLYDRKANLYSNPVQLKEAKHIVSNVLNRYIYLTLYSWNVTNTHIVKVHVQRILLWATYVNLVLCKQKCKTKVKHYVCNLSVC